MKIIKSLKGYWKAAFAFAAMGAILAAGGANAASSDEPKGLTSEKVSEFKNKVKDLEKAYVDYAGELETLKGKYYHTSKQGIEADFAKKRAAQAKINFDHNDYEAAAIMYLDLLEGGYAKDAQLEYEISYYLAECLYQRHNYFLAKKYFKAVIDKGEKMEFFDKSVTRLIQIAVELNELDDAQKHYELIKGRNLEVGDLIKYNLAKTYFDRGKIDDAQKIFETIKQGSCYIKSQYYLGVIESVRTLSMKDEDKARLEKLVAAQEIFEKLAKTQAGSKDDAYVIQLANMNVARILYERSLIVYMNVEEGKKTEAQKNEEMGLVNKALSLYRKIPMDSPYYDQSYYEMVWIYIRRAQYKDALNAIEIMIASMPESLYAPEAQLTKAELLGKLDKQREAGTMYQSIVSNWQDVVDTFDKLIKLTSGKRASAINKEAMDKVKNLPIVAIKWLKQERNVEKALALENELADLKTRLKELTLILDKLVAAQQQDKKARVSPKLREGRESGLNLQNKILAIKETLGKISSEIVAFKIGSDMVKDYEDAKKTRMLLEEKYKNLPKNDKERAEHKESLLSKIQNLNDMAFRLKMQIDGLSEKLKEIVSKKERMRNKPNIAPDFFKKLDERIENETKAIEGLNNLYDAIKSKVELQSQAVNIGQQDSKEEQLVKDYEKALAKEQELQVKVQSKMNKDEMAIFNSAQILSDKATKLNLAVDGYLADLDNIGSTWIKDYDGKITAQKQSLDSWKTEMDAVESDLNKTSTEIIIGNIKNIRDHFYNIVLEADAGNVEIVWQKWLEVATELDELQKEKKLKESQLSEAYTKSKFEKADEGSSGAGAGTGVVQ